MTRRRRYHAPGWQPTPTPHADLRPETLAKVQELADQLGMFNIDVIAQAVDQMIENLPPQQGKLFEALP